MILLAALVRGDDRVSIDINPPVVPLGSMLRIRCKVPRHKDNRLLAYGIVGHAESQIPWEGEDAPETRTVWVKNIPCDLPETTAWCGVLDVNGKTYLATKHFAVGGCIGDHGISEANAAPSGLRR